MDTSTIDSIIRSCQQEPDHQHDLRELLVVVAERNGRSPEPDAIDEAAGFVASYVEQVPYCVKVAFAAAEVVGLGTEMNQVLQRLIDYWEQDDDVIPDQLGIIGLLDDAYCTLSALQAVSDQFQLQSGKHLFPDDLTPANRLMRLIIGEPYASKLDREVQQVIRQSRLLDSLKRLASGEKKLNFERDSTIWNHDPVSRPAVSALTQLGLEIDAD